MDKPTQVSIDMDCLDTLELDMIGFYAPVECQGPWEIDIMGPQGSMGDTITKEMLGKTYMVVISSDADGGQNCMTAITVLDKKPPVISCLPDTTVPCTTPLDSLPQLPLDSVMDCQDVELTFFDNKIFSGECRGDTFGLVVREYTAKDEDGNIATCTQRIAFMKADLMDVEFPPEFKADSALICTDADTSPANTGFPMIDGNPIVNSPKCNLYITREKDRIKPGCDGTYKITRRWIVMDWCDEQNNMLMYDQTIEVKDTTPPDVMLPDTIHARAGQDCDADVMLPPADIFGDCDETFHVRMEGPFGTIKGNGGFVPDLPVGVHQIIYIAQNECLLEGRDTTILVIADKDGPTAICNREISVPLGNMGMALIHARALDGGSYDNCGDVFFKARRMDPPDGFDCIYNGNDLYLFDDRVKFCCEDIPGSPVMVLLRVYDKQPVEGPVADDYLEGHFTDCMAMVELQDKQGPQLTCPSDLTISCELDFVPDNLDLFGKVVQAPDTPDSICFDDPGQGGFACRGIDGVASDNCNVMITRDMESIMDSLCGTGMILRRFLASDDDGRTAECEQKITIENFEPFDSMDIDWPDDFITSNICDIASLDPENLPPANSVPILTKDECDLTAFDYVDEVFDFSNSSEACFKILRTWTVIDWCQFEDNNPRAGRWTRTQLIKVQNTVPPSIDSVGTDMQVCSDDPGCGDATVDLYAEGSDDCTAPGNLIWRISIDENDDKTIDDILLPGPGPVASLPYAFPIGDHRVIYALQDLCGNTVTAEQFISVENCKPPSPLCHGLTTTLMNAPGGPMIEIWASDLDKGSFDACGGDVQVAFSTDPADTGRTFTCADIGTNSVQLFVINEAGLTAFCTVDVIIQDNQSLCNGGEVVMGAISGTIKSESSINMNEVMVELVGSNQKPAYTKNGSYRFAEMPLGGEYTVRPRLDGDHRNGVSTIDLVKIQKHLLGIEVLDNPYKLIAADANGSGSVSAVDIFELRKLILGINEELPNSPSWRFIDATRQFTDPRNPFTEGLPEGYAIESFDSDMSGVDFVGVKIGDINESAQLFHKGGKSSTTRAPEEYITIADALLETGETIELPVTYSRLRDAQAIQFTLEWDVAAFELLDVVAGPRGHDAQYSAEQIDEGILPFSWHELDASMSPTDVLFTLRLRAKQTLQISDVLRMTGTVAEREGYTVYDNLFTPALQFRGVATASHAPLVVYQNVPNPFSGETQIAFDVDEAQRVSLQIYDALGRTLYTDEMDATAGRNQFTVQGSAIQAKGLILYTVRSGQSQQTRRMIIDKE